MRERYHRIQRGEHVVQPPDSFKAPNATCSHCREAFHRPPANITSNSGRKGANDYCSRKCMGQAFIGRMVGESSPRWKGVESRDCWHCNAPVIRPLWAWKGKTQTFCNRKCFGLWRRENYGGENNPCWKGGRPYSYGASWEKQQRAARRRDGNECQLCGLPRKSARRNLDVHHIRPFRFFGVSSHREANDLTNLVTLCEGCHHSVEPLCANGDVLDWATLKILVDERQQQREAA